MKIWTCSQCGAAERHVTIPEGCSVCGGQMDSQDDRRISGFCEGVVRYRDPHGIEPWAAEAIRAFEDEIDAANADVAAVVRLWQSGANLDERVNSLIADRLDTEINEILSIAPKELKFSELVEAMVSAAAEDLGSRYGSRVTCIVEEDERYGWLNVWLDKEHRTEKRDCEIRFTVSKDGGLLSCSLDNKDPKKTVRMGPMWGYQKMLFGAYCCGSKIVMDDLDPPTNVGDW